MGKHRCRLLRLVPCLPLFLLASCGRGTDEPIRIGLLTGFTAEFPTIDGFVDGMRDFGYVDGENVIFDIREVRLETEDREKVIEGLIGDGADLIFAFPTEPALMAKREIGDRDIPIIFAVSSIEIHDLIDSMELPGGNITGIRYPTLEVALKRYELMKAIAPKARRIAVPYDLNDPRIDLQLIPLRALAALDSIDLVEMPGESREELIARLEDSVAGGAPEYEAMLIIVEPLAHSIAPWVSGFSETHGIPVGGYPYSMIMPNTLFSVGIDYYETGKTAASLADKVLRGTPAGEIPVLSSDLRITVNYQRAVELGLDIPESILAAADEIIMD